MVSFLTINIAPCLQIFCDNIFSVMIMLFITELGGLYAKLVVIPAFVT